MSAAIDPTQARATARKILDGPRYRGAPVPRPLHGVLRWIGDRISPITHWIGDRFSWLPNWSQPWAEALGVAVFSAVAIFIIVTITNARARNRAARLGRDDASARTAAAAAEDAVALEAAATEAEAHGDHALAVRLRFRAGLLRLDRDAHAIAYRPSLATGDVRDELASPEFDALADRFERIAYGGEEAEPTDTAGARQEWPRVVDSARKR